MNGPGRGNAPASSRPIPAPAARRQQLLHPHSVASLASLCCGRRRASRLLSDVGGRPVSKNLAAHFGHRLLSADTDVQHEPAACVFSFHFLQRRYHLRRRKRLFRRFGFILCSSPVTSSNNRFLQMTGCYPLNSAELCAFEPMKSFPIFTKSLERLESKILQFMYFFMDCF